ncbi:hypothetical protein Goklo_024354 [Gossypium klotzschianum]|uniref:DUF7745 domain-containing protein n=1 Tax=Gossypium klotzschianum TaxID=34286 RepID=A0A7J8WCQ7_9ROSI|nr:hypothetical protein [Gossypium klotzschianum]
MEKGFLDKVEDNAAVRTWSETTQHEKGDSLAEGYVSKLWDFTRISVTQNSLQELKEIWDQWNDEVRQLFYSYHGDLPYLLDMKVDKHLFQALARFLNPTNSCFTFEKVDLLPTVEEYMALLRCSKIQVDRAYSRTINVPTFLKKLMNITEISEQWVTAQIKQKRISKCIPWKNLKDLILAHLDTKKKVDIFTLSIYSLVVFPKDLGHVDEAVTDLFDRLDKRVTPVLVILAETFRSLSACRKAGVEMDGYCSESVGGGYQVESSEMKRLAVGPMTNLEYNKWWVRRINDNILEPSQENSQSIEEHLWVVPSELEIIKQDFERRNAKLEKKIEQIEEKRMNLRLDMDV